VNRNGSNELFVSSSSGTVLSGSTSKLTESGSPAVPAGASVRTTAGRVSPAGIDSTFALASGTCFPGDIRTRVEAESAEPVFATVTVNRSTFPSAAS
jgi:hypothetical protein